MDNNGLSGLVKCENEGWLSIKTKLPTTKDDLELELSGYSLIAIHLSWMAQANVRNTIEEYAKRFNKFFIVFSGGITQNLLMNNRKRLNINVAYFYQQNLVEILSRFANNECAEPLLELLYGKSWRLSLLMQYRNIMWLGGNNEKEYELRTLISESGDDHPLSSDFIEKEIIKEIRNSKI